MAVSAKGGTIDVPGSTGSVAYTGVGFQAQAVLFYATSLTADGDGSGYETCFGIVDANLDQFVGTGSADDAGANTNTGNDMRGMQNGATTNCVRLTDAAGTILIAGECLAIGSDGFTIDWTTVTSGVDVHYLAIAGFDNVKADDFAAATGTGDDAITGVGFQPDAVLLVMFQNDSFINAGHKAECVGAFTASAQWVSYCLDPDTQATCQAARGQLTTACVRKKRLNFQTGVTAAFSSMDADGFTLNYSTVDLAHVAWYLAVKGGSIALGADTQPTSATTKKTENSGFTPVATLLVSFGRRSSAGTEDNMASTFGVAVSPTDRRAIWKGSVHDSDPIESSSSSDQDKVIKMMTAASGGAPTTEAEADLSSHDSDGFTLDWTTADATPRQFLYLSFGSNPTPASDEGINITPAVDFAVDGLPTRLLLQRQARSLRISGIPAEKFEGDIIAIVFGDTSGVSGGQPSDLGWIWVDPQGHRTIGAPRHDAKVWDGHGGWETSRFQIESNDVTDDILDGVGMGPDGSEFREFRRDMDTDNFFFFAMPHPTDSNASSGRMKFRGGMQFLTTVTLASLSEVLPATRTTVDGQTAWSTFNAEDAVHDTYFSYVYAPGPGYTSESTVAYGWGWALGSFQKGDGANP